MTKKRIAIWIHGGVGTGHFSQGYPPLEKLLLRLSQTFELVIYSQFAIDQNYRQGEFVTRSAPSKVKWGPLRWIYLFKYFIVDHREKRYHAIFPFWGYPAGFLAVCLSKIVRLPCVIYILGSDSAGIKSIDFGIFHKRIPRTLALWAYSHAVVLLAISDYQKKQLMSFGVTKRIVTIPWGVETSMYKFGAKKRGDVLKIIHVGHLTPVKDQETLLKTLAIIARKHLVELRIFGVDCMNGAIQKVSADMGLEKVVRFLDMVPYDEMPSHYTWADMMLHTSLSEGQSMAMTEAAACGVLVAGTRVGLLHDLGDQCGIVVEVGDFEGLASKVLDVMENQQSWDDRVNNAKSWSESHDLDWTISTLCSVLNNIS